MRRLGLALGLALLSCGGTRLPGEKCKSHGDCGSLPDGYCARAEICTRECDDARPCPDGSACVWGGGRQVCLPTCTKDDECPKGFFCAVSAEPKVCHLANPLAPPPAD
ncbi:MAG: hypothetical protein AMXMBFR34_45560 [Myxococcaceae bacterium]